ncbi:MAG TPA: hypothetical protein VHV77_00885 [Pirellulales bacterium]|nr:hypothetical protein [Pirellulales bacterium]
MALPKRLWPSVRLLLQAHEQAIDTGHSLEDFAVEIRELRRRGMNNNDCRWFVCKGWAHLVQELEPQNGELRRFRHDVGLLIDRRTCLVLTPEGELAVRGLGTEKHEILRVEKVEVVHSQPIIRTVPLWDRDRHELRLGTQLIKQFKLPSPNQETILSVFHEENWPARIDDPLPPSKRINTKQRLHDTIKSLNRNQRTRLLRFLGDGTGEGVRWELIVEQTASG